MHTTNFFHARRKSYPDCVYDDEKQKMHTVNYLKDVWMNVLKIHDTALVFVCLFASPADDDDDDDDSNNNADRTSPIC